MPHYRLVCKNRNVELIEYTTEEELTSDMRNHNVSELSVIFCEEPPKSVYWHEREDGSLYIDYSAVSEVG